MRLPNGVANPILLLVEVKTPVFAAYVPTPDIKQEDTFTLKGDC